jgi:hypothetical protein
MNHLPWLFVLILVGNFLAGSPFLGTVQAADPGVAAAGVTNSAVNYLLANYNSTVGLIRNSPDSQSLSNTYYLYSDNFLAVLAFQNQGPGDATLAGVSSNITKSIHLYIEGQPNPVNQYEALTTPPIPAFNASKDFVIYTRGLETISTTVNNQSSTWLDLHDYADIAFLEAIYYYNFGNNAAASSAYHVGVAMYDGIGFKDSVPGNYQTYKLALYIYASRLLGLSYYASAFSQLIAMQATSGVDKGGFYTCYGSDAVAACGTNTETTALALLALSGYPPPSLTSVPEFPFGMALLLGLAVPALLLVRKNSRALYQRKLSAIMALGLID